MILGRGGASQRQKVLGFSPLAAGLFFGVLGLGTVSGGISASRVIGKIGTKPTLIAGGILQTVFTAALIGLGDDRSWMGLMLPASFLGGDGRCCTGVRVLPQRPLHLHRRSCA